MSLSAQKQHFETEGYLILENLLTADELTQCLAEIDRLHHIAAESETNSELGKSDFQLEPYAGGAKRDDGLPVLRKIESTYKYSQLFKDLATKPRLVEVLTALLGPDVLQFRSTLMLKPPHHGSAHRFHQDSSYWPIDPPSLVTVSIALTDATPENGCIEVIPRSHTLGKQDWGHIAGNEDKATSLNTAVDTKTAQHVPLKAGSALLFHSLTVHGSGPNKSPNPRNTALYAYLSPHVKYMPGEGQPNTVDYRVIAGCGGKETYTMTADN